MDDEVSLSNTRRRCGVRCRELLCEITISKEIVAHAGSINRDLVHLLINIPPRLFVSKAVQYLKGKSFHRFPSEHLQLIQRYWSQHLWAKGLRGYWVASSGNIIDEVWLEFIKNQTLPKADDTFEVT